MRAPRKQIGFTLVELIVTIVVATIVMGFMAMFIGTPIQAYIAQTKRATLSDAAEIITRNIATDVGVALPNSTRVISTGTFFVLEMLSTVDVLRYRAEGDGPGPDNELKYGAADDKFSALGAITQPFAFVAINNQGIAPADAYARTNVMTPVAGINVNLATHETDIVLTPPFTFNAPAAPLGSPSHSVFLVTGPVAYLCDANSGTLQKYTGYTIDPALTARDSDAELMTAGATRSLIATNVTACDASRSAATKWHGDLVTLRVALTTGGETFPVFYQAQVGRRP
jgi:MSHA biogenesis protein MshO